MCMYVCSTQTAGFWYPIRNCLHYLFNSYAPIWQPFRVIDVILGNGVGTDDVFEIAVVCGAIKPMMFFHCILISNSLHKYRGLLHMVWARKKWWCHNHFSEAHTIWNKPTNYFINYCPHFIRIKISHIHIDIGLRSSNVPIYCIVTSNKSGSGRRSTLNEMH